MSANAAARPIVEVAVGVLVRADGTVLLADRPAGKPYAGYWEFPGGKVEPGETIGDALARELREELGIELGPSMPWVVYEHDYPHAYVRLHFRRVFEWRGEPHPHEGQRFDFFLPAQAPQPLLPAALPALRWLELPAVYGVSNAAALGPDGFLHALDRALARGLRLLLLREPSLDESRIAKLASPVRDRAREVGARVLISSRHAQSLWPAFDGVHLTARDLMRTQQRPDALLVAASVHDRDELARAHRLGCDFAMAGPVLATPSHPGAATLGWNGFARIARDTPLPLYAIGGLAVNDLAAARYAGGHGVALLRAAWSG